MAQQVNVVLIDDLDGSAAAETVTFGLDGISYEIDVSDENAARLRDAMAEWVGDSRRVGGGSRRRAGTRSPSAKSDRQSKNGAIREWARSNGHPVAERGRIKAEVVEAYTAAHA